MGADESLLAGSTNTAAAGPAQDDVRFPFGRNWESFLGTLNESRIAEAERSLELMLGANRIKGSRFLDVGSGSGIFSLAAMRLGARQVHSFDADPSSVACTNELRRRFFPNSATWTVDHASALDSEYLKRLGTWEIVYSWGVLHHTGNMWAALGGAATLVAPAGLLFVSIYNDQGPISRGWRVVKSIYNRSTLGKAAVLGVFVPYFAGRGILVDLVRLENPMRRYTEYYRSRGMSILHDWRDWLGGYPFEVAKPEEILHFFVEKGFSLIRLRTCGGRLGCNEFVFTRR